jgi:hypothetical protein
MASWPAGTPTELASILTHDARTLIIAILQLLPDSNAGKALPTTALGIGHARRAIQLDGFAMNDS